MPSGGKRDGSGRKKGDPRNRGRRGRQPEDFMRMLVPVQPQPEAEAIEPELVDFAIPKGYVDPVTFCLAVINDDRQILLKCGVAKIPDLATKMEAARISVKFTNKPMPVQMDVNHTHEHSWRARIEEAEARAAEIRAELDDDRRPAETIN